MKKIFFISTVALGLTLASCDSYLDINTDPNSPSEEVIEAGMLMPAAEMNLATSYGHFLRIAGGYFAQQYAQAFGTENFVGYSQFNMSATRSSSTYTQLTQKALNNMKTILEKSKKEEDWGTYLAATTLRAFTYETLVDCYGEIPYSEALDISKPNPKYDDGETIYEGLLNELDQALALVSPADLVCTNFLYPSETAEPWIQFANALKLKLYMRMANVKNVSTQVAALIAEDNFPTEDVAYAGCWTNASGQANPFFSEEFATWGSQKNLIANLTITGSMIIKGDDGDTEYQDPRLEAFFEPNSDGEYFGGISGTNMSTASLSLAQQNRPVASYDMPLYLITVSEVEFFLAEYYARYGSADEAAAHYAAAVEASFESAGVTGADEYIARYPYDNGNYRKSLGEAKWIALAGVNNFEAWCELRRLDYPAFGTKKGSDFFNVTSGDIDESGYEPYTLYTPIQVFGQVGDNKVLERFPYPESSTSRNSNAPAFPGYTTPVFWGK